MIRFIKTVSDYLEGLRKGDSTRHCEMENILQLSSIPVFDGQWASKVSNEVWKYMKENDARRPEYNGSKMIHLLRLIRNTSDHYDELPFKVKEELGELPYGFMTYWLHKFPKLLVMLYAFSYTNILKHSQAIRQFYNETTEQFTSLSDLDESVQAVINRILHQIKIGGFLKRYNVWKKGAVAESYKSQVTFLKLSTSFGFNQMSLIMEIRDGILRVVHTISFQNSVVLLQCPIKSQTSVTVVFARNEFLCSAQWKMPIDTSQTVVLTSVTNLDLIEKTMLISFGNESLEYRDTPLTWEELDENYQHVLLQRNVMFQGCQITLNNIFTWISNLEIIKKLKVEALRGQLLQDIIDDKIPEVVPRTKHEVPSYYINRKLLPRKFVSCDNIKRSLNSYMGTYKLIVIPLVVDQGQDEAFFSGMFSSKYMKLSSCVMNEEKLTYPLLILLEDSQHLDQIMNKHRHPSFTLLKYHNGVYFEWITSKGYNKMIKNHLENVSVSEDELINDFLQKDQNQPILIADSPGMGKTTILHNIANKLILKCPTKIVKFYTLPEFVANLPSVRNRNNLENSNCAESNAKLVDRVIAIFSERDKGPSFYNTLVEALLLSRVDNTPVTTMELIFDGFDECDLEQWANADCVIRIVEQDIKNVRMWVATRLHYAGSLEHAIPIKSYCIARLDRNQQVNLLIKIWSKSMSAQDLQLHHETLEKLANYCLDYAPRDYMSIAEIPLQCRLLADAHDLIAQSLVAGKSSFESVTESLGVIASVLDLYEKVIETKLEVYMVKQGMEFQGPRSSRIVNQTRERMTLAHQRKAVQILMYSWAESFSNNYFLQEGSKVDCVLAYGLLESKGILEETGSRRQDFIHRTYGEYFIASFMIGLLHWTNPTGHDFLTKIGDFFINGILKMNESTKLFANGTVIIKFLSAMLETRKTIVSTEIYSAIRHSLFKKEDWIGHLNKIILALIQTETVGTLNLLLKSLENEQKIAEFVQGCSKDKLGDLICKAVEGNNVHVLKRIFDFVKEGGICFNQIKYWSWSEDIEYDGLRKRIDISHKPLVVAVTRTLNFEIIKFLVNFSDFHDIPIRKEYLGGVGILHLCIHQLKIDCRRKRKGKRCLGEGLKVIQFLVEKDREILEEYSKWYKTPRGDFTLQDVGVDYCWNSTVTPLIYATSVGAPVEVIQCLIELGANVNSVDYENNFTMLHYTRLRQKDANGKKRCT
ncbi:unnamed protein product [Orchesella dallaii]